MNHLNAFIHEIQPTNNQLSSQIYLTFGFLVSALLMSSSPLSAQTPDEESQQPKVECGYDVMHQELLLTNDEYKKKYRKQEMDRIDNLRTGNLRNTGVIYNMPCVVHIIHSGESLGTTANPTDAEITQIVSQASDRFRHMHPGALNYTNPNYGIDSEIELCMAREDPDGNYTTGVTRHYAPDLAIGAYGDVAGGMDLLSWNKSEYINLFIMTNMTNASGVYIGGLDFTIYTSSAFWSGLIAHELGHYFSLAHTFSGGCTNGDCLTNGDGVCDTPPKAFSGTTGPCGGTGNSCLTDEDDTSTNNPYRPISAGGLGDQFDMLENYMDYTASCWDAFTQGQTDRMRNNIQSNRLSIANNDAVCTIPADPLYEVEAIQASDNRSGNCNPVIEVVADIRNLGTQTLTSLELGVFANDSLVYVEHWTGSLLQGGTTSVNISDTMFNLGLGENIIEIRLSNPNGNSDANIYNNSAYVQMLYYGGLNCIDYSACQDFNPDSDMGSGNFTVVDIGGPFSTLPADVENILICVTTIGDQSFDGEILDIYDEDNTFRGQTNYGTDCGGYTPEVCFSIDSNLYNLWRGDNVITLTLDPDTTFINPLLCGTNEACATLHIVVGGDSINYGCTEANAHNYDPNATINDGSCETCFDGIQNGDETDVDCGGVICIPCADLCPNLTFTNVEFVNDQIYITVINNGNVTAVMDGFIVLQAYWNNDTLPSGSGAGGWVMDFFAPDLLPGQEWSFNWSQTNSGGNQFLVVHVDRDNNMVECDETDNVGWFDTYGISGCTDPTAHNYDPLATNDDGSCETCTDGILNGDETSIDCGGILCEPCTVLGGDCPNTLNLNGLTITDGKYKADQLLISDNVLQGIGFALYESGADIELNSNFEVELGVQFEARIKNCVPD